YKDKFFDAAVNQAIYEGKIWGVPIENTIAAMVFYNKELFEKHGWSEPKTISELESLAENMLAAGIIPFSLANKTKWTGSMYYMYLVDRIGGSDVFYNAANRVNGGSFEHPAFIEAGKKLVEWVDRGFFNDGFNGLDEDTGQSRMLLYTDKAAMTIMGSWFLQTVQGENPDFMKKVGAFAFPAYDGGLGNANAVVGTVGDNFYHISANSKNPEAAFKYLQYIIDDESVKNRIQAGKIPPVKGVVLTDEKTQMVLDIINKAPSVQLWYDQYLPSELAEVHKDTLQSIFGKIMTPEAACKEWEVQAKKILGSSN
ncbi:MAG: extracellular solute-binding protein, partial [Treponemataceae bacterium]